MASPASDVRSTAELSPTSRWRRPFSILQTNLQEIDAEMDVEAAADAVSDYGADTWMVNAGGITSFYPTDLPFQTRNPHLASRPSGDLLGDAVASAKKRGIKVIARFDMSKVSARIAAEHPEWLYRTPDGDVQLYNDLYSACPSGDYYQQRVFDVLDEALDRYDIDGIFFNWFNFNERDYSGVLYPPCHCDSCVAGFSRFTDGEPLPADMTSPKLGQWRAFTSATLAGLTARIVDHVRAREADIGVIIRRGAPIEYLEGNNAFRAMPGKELWPFATSEAVSAHQTSEPDSAVVVNCVGFIDAAYRMGAEQPEHFAQHMLQAIARGANPSAFFLGAPGRLPFDRAISVGRRVMRFFQAHRELYDGLRPASQIALVRPDYASGAAGGYWDVVEEFRGVFQGLVEGHLPFDVIPIDKLPEMAAGGALARFQLVILPDVGDLRGAAPALDAFVANGGRVLTTGSAGVGRESSVQMASFPAVGVASSRLAGDDLRATFATAVPQPHASRHQFESPVYPVFGAYQAFDWSTEARLVGSVLSPAPFGPPEMAYGHTLTAEPDHVRRDYGSGEVVAVPWTIGRTYREYGKTDVRDHLLAIVHSLVRIDVNAESAPESVEIIVGRTGSRTVVHLINHSGLRRRSYGPHLPIDGIRLRVSGAAGSRVSALAAETAPVCVIDGEDVIITLPTLDLFEVLVIEEPESPPVIP